MFRLGAGIERRSRGGVRVVCFGAIVFGSIAAVFGGFAVSEALAAVLAQPLQETRATTRDEGRSGDDDASVPKKGRLASGKSQRESPSGGPDESQSSVPRKESTGRFRRSEAASGGDADPGQQGPKSYHESSSFFIDARFCSNPQLVFLTGVYGYILYQASELISSGSELLLLIPNLAGIVGTVVLPVLAAVPDALMIFFSGLGNPVARDPGSPAALISAKKAAAAKFAVGVGTLAGSTVMLVTIPWFLAILGGLVDLDPLTGSPMYKAGGGLLIGAESSSPRGALDFSYELMDDGPDGFRGSESSSWWETVLQFLATSFPGIARQLGWVRAGVLRTRGLCLRRGVGVAPVVRANAKFMAYSLLGYVMVLVPAWYAERLYDVSPGELEQSGGSFSSGSSQSWKRGDAEASFESTFVFVAALECFAMFFFYLYMQWRHLAKANSEKDAARKNIDSGIEKPTGGPTSSDPSSLVAASAPVNSLRMFRGDGACLGSDLGARSQAAFVARTSDAISECGSDDECLECSPGGSCSNVLLPTIGQRAPETRPKGRDDGDSVKDFCTPSAKLFCRCRTLPAVLDSGEGVHNDGVVQSAPVHETVGNTKRWSRSSSVTAEQVLAGTESGVIDEFRLLEDLISDRVVSAIKKGDLTLRGALADVRLTIESSMRGKPPRGHNGVSTQRPNFGQAITSDFTAAQHQSHRGPRARSRDREPKGDLPMLTTTIGTPAGGAGSSHNLAAPPSAAASRVLLSAGVSAAKRTADSENATSGESTPEKLIEIVQPAIRSVDDFHPGFSGDGLEARRVEGHEEPTESKEKRRRTKSRDPTLDLSPKSSSDGAASGVDDRPPVVNPFANGRWSWGDGFDCAGPQDKLVAAARSGSSLGTGSGSAASAANAATASLGLANAMRCSFVVKNNPITGGGKAHRDSQSTLSGTANTTTTSASPAPSVCGSSSLSAAPNDLTTLKRPLLEKFPAGTGGAVLSDRPEPQSLELRSASTDSVLCGQTPVPERGISGDSIVGRELTRGRSKSESPDRVEQKTLLLDDDVSQKHACGDNGTARRPASTSPSRSAGPKHASLSKKRTGRPPVRSQPDIFGHATASTRAGFRGHLAGGARGNNTSWRVSFQGVDDNVQRYQEFCNAVPPALYRKARKILAPFFMYYDRNHDNTIDFPEFRMLFYDLNEPMGVAQMQWMFDNADINKDGVISFSEFIYCMLNFACAGDFGDLGGGFAPVSGNWASTGSVVGGGSLMHGGGSLRSHGHMNGHVGANLWVAGAQGLQHGSRWATRATGAVIFSPGLHSVGENSPTHASPTRRAEPEAEGNSGVTIAKENRLAPASGGCCPEDAMGRLDDEMGRGLGSDDVDLGDDNGRQFRTAVSEDTESRGSHTSAESEAPSIPTEWMQLSPRDQQKRIKMKSAWLLSAGTILALLFSDPAADLMTEIGVRLGISPFYVSFFLVPLASNASELVASYHYAKKKTMKSMTISLSTLEGAACMNNTLCLGVFLGLIYWRRVEWRFTSETLALIVVELCVVWTSMTRSVHTLFDAVKVLCLFPMCLVLTVFLKDYIGLQ